MILVILENYFLWVFKTLIYIEKNIHLEGAITTNTLSVVTNRVFTTFQAMSKVNPFQKDEKIFINIPDSSIVDGSFASVIGTFLTKSLAEFSGISINMGKTNIEKVKNSEGYITIRDFIIKNLWHHMNAIIGSYTIGTPTWCKNTIGNHIIKTSHNCCSNLLSSHKKQRNKY